MGGVFHLQFGLNSRSIFPVATDWNGDQIDDIETVSTATATCRSTKARPRVFRTLASFNLAAAVDPGGRTEVLQA